MTSSLQPAEAADLAAGRGAEGRRRSTFKVARIAPYAFVLPALALFIAFLLLPIIYATWLSFRANRRTGGGILGKLSETFVGFENYTRSLTDPVPVSYTHL